MLKRKNSGRPHLVKGVETIRASFTLPETLWADFVKEAEKANLTYSELFRHLIYNYLEKKD